MPIFVASALAVRVGAGGPMDGRAAAILDAFSA